MYDGLQVEDLGNRPDLWFEIPALLNDETLEFTHPGVSDITSPLGSNINENSSIYHIDAAEFGWDQTTHSDFLEKTFPLIWPWYERLTEKSGDPQGNFPNGIIPVGQE